MSGQIVPFAAADAASTAVAQFDEAADQVRRLIAIGQTLEIDLPADAAALERLSEQMADDLDRRAAAHGLVLLALREQIPHGHWLTHLGAIGLKERSAQLRMQVAKLLLVIGPANAKPVSHLPFRHQIALARLDPHLVDTMIEEGALEDVASLKTEQFEKWTRERKRRMDAEERIHTAEVARARAEQQYAEILHHQQSAPLAHLRRVCAEEVEAVQVASIGMVGQILDALHQMPHSADARQISDVLVHVRWAIHAARQQLAAAQEQLESAYPGALNFDLPPLPPALTDAERAAAHEFREWAHAQQSLRAERRGTAAALRRNPAPTRGKRK